MQDTTDYWEAFEKTKIVYPDISKLPRFSMDLESRYMGNTGFFIPIEDYYLLGVLASWSSWFLLSKTAQPLRLRGDRWQYRLFSQYVEKLPIPNANNIESESIAELARVCTETGKVIYDSQELVRHRLTSTFQEKGEGKLNNKASDWWTLSLNQLGDSLKTSFKLDRNPLKSPTVADEWESYLTARKRQLDELTTRLEDAEKEINDRVFRLFDLSKSEIELLQREVEH